MLFSLNLPFTKLDKKVPTQQIALEIVTIQLGVKKIRNVRDR